MLKISILLIITKYSKQQAMSLCIFQIREIQIFLQAMKMNLKSVKYDIVQAEDSRITINENVAVYINPKDLLGKKNCSFRNDKNRKIQYG